MMRKTDMHQQHQQQQSQQLAVGVISLYSE